MAGTIWDLFEMRLWIAQLKSTMARHVTIFLVYLVIKVTVDESKMKLYQKFLLTMND
jgi:hypothetical protein